MTKNCEKYMSLSHKEKVEFIGKVVHTIQNNDAAFEIAENIIDVGNINGLFDNVVINPSINNETFNHGN